MARAEFPRIHGRPAQLRRLVRLISHGLLPMLAAAQALPGHAQTQAPAGSPTDVRYTPVQGSATALFPRQPGDGNEASSVLAQGAFAINAAVGRIVVEVTRNALPADGQSHVQVTIKVSGQDGQPLAGLAFVTVEHSGGRLLVPGARTDEFGPRALDADRAVPGVQVPVKDGLLTLTLIAPAEAQDVRLRVTAGNQQASGTLSFVPEQIGRAHV